MLKICRKSWPSISRYIKAGKSNKKIDTINENEKENVGQRKKRGEKGQVNRKP